MTTDLPSFLTLTSPGRYVLTMSASAAECVMLCPAKYAWSRVTGIEAVAARVGQTYGKALHLALQHRYAHMDRSLAQVEEEASTIMAEHFAANPLPEMTSKGKPEWRTLARAQRALAAYNAAFPAEDFEVAGVEEPFECELGRLSLPAEDGFAHEVTVRVRGIRDLRVKWHDQLWVLDHKTSTEWSDLNVDEGRASFQFMLYAWVEKQLQVELAPIVDIEGNQVRLITTPVGGVIGNYLISRQPYSEGRKPTPRDLPRDQFHREPYPFSDAQLAEWHEDAMDLAKEIFTRWSTQNWKRNRTACAHWGRCEYYRLCWETDPAYREAAALSADYRPRTPSPFEDSENGKERA